MDDIEVFAYAVRALLLRVLLRRRRWLGLLRFEPTYHLPKLLVKRGSVS